MARQKKIKVKSLTNIKSKLCDNPELSEDFINDVLRITGLEYDSEGYIIDPEDDPIEPAYIQIKGKVLRYTNTGSGVIHSSDIIFDPYNNPMIMEELFKKYLEEFHHNVVSTQIFAHSMKSIPKIDTYGYISINYGNGAKIVTGLHYKDSTKYLDAFMRMESMTDATVMETLRKYDEYEKSIYYENDIKERIKR